MFTDLPYGNNIWTYIINIIFKINDMRLLANAYMKKGNIHQGDKAAVKVSFTVFVTKYLELCSYQSAALWHLLKKDGFFDKPFHVPIVSSSLFSTLIPPTANKKSKHKLICLISSGTMKPWESQENTSVRRTTYAVLYIIIPDFIMKREENYKKPMRVTNRVTWYVKRYFEYMSTFTLKNY